jgi:N-acetylneuraminic acid mutarotase
MDAMKIPPQNDIIQIERRAEQTSWTVSAISILARRVAFPLLFLGAGLVMVQPCAGDPFVFEYTGNLGTARFSHTATLLPNGKVLVAGGRGTNSDVLASAELYDPASGSWTITGSLATGRSGHSATLLSDGKVLVTGGYNGSSILPSAELYDATSGTWTTTGSLGAARSDHTATLLPNGKVLVAGGYLNGDIASAELYDPTSGTWMTIGSLATARDAHTATLLPNGEVLVAGGYNDNNGYLASAELYDPASGTWTVTGNLVNARGHHTSTLLPNGNVLLTGGVGTGGALLKSAELYDPTTGSWTATGSLATTRQQHTATMLPNGKVMVTGGDYMLSRFFSPSAELYDPATGMWSFTGSPLSVRQNHTATMLSNGEVLVAGGLDGTHTTLASAEVYEIPETLLNISTRMEIFDGDRVLIAGFIVTGTDQKTVLIRGIGPSLNGVGITLSDPTLELHDGNTTIATNDNWKTKPDGTSQEAEIEATTIPPTNDLESALVATLNPGAYTAVLAGKNGGTGIGLVEVYDLAQGANSKMANISTRGFVDTGDNVMIGGLIIGGGGSGSTAQVLVRALGPSVPVAGALGDPTLELHDGSGTTIASNDNWKTRPNGTSQQGEIEATTIPPTNDLESALLSTLGPGNYTAIVRGKNNTTGVGLVEVYNLQ